jgi:hypothetical protein
MGTHSRNEPPPTTGATAGTAPRDSLAYGCRGSFHLIAACNSTAPFRFSGSSPHETTPCSPGATLLHRLLRLANCIKGGSASTLRRRGDFVVVGSSVGSRMPNAVSRAIAAARRAEIEPLLRMPSSSVALPGPILAPDPKILLSLTLASPNHSRWRG